jgi:hypothetical protein
MKIIAGIVGGLGLAILGMLVAGLVFATAIANGHGGVGVGAFFVFWLVGLFIAIQSPSASKAWRRLLLIAAVMCFLLPLAGLVFTGSVISQMDTSGANGGARAAGAVIGGGLVSGILGFVGFFAGIVCLVVGLLVGRDKQVVHVQGWPPSLRT